MSKILLAIMCISTLLLALPSYAEKEKAKKQDFKCYLDSTAGDKVMFFRWLEEEKLKQQAGLIAQKVTSGGQDIYIKSVMECVLLGQPFKSAKANKLDEKTVR